MFGFDVNEPLKDPRMIAAAIGAYATPEAAQSDFQTNAPEGLDYFNKEYQRLTGDWFADPFKDAITQAVPQRIAEASAGRRVFGNMPLAAFSPTTPVVPNVATLQPGPPSPLSVPPPVAPAALAASPMARLNAVGSPRFPSNLQLPSADTSGYVDAIKRRANVAGVRPEFDAIMANDPKAFIPSGEDLTNDPLFSRLQGPNGKALAGDIHSIVFNPKFREYLATNPEKADKIYYAATGQDFSTARNAKIQQYVEERAQQEKILEGFKGLTADPVTGDVYHTVEQKDQFGNSITKTEVPLDPLYVNMLKARGGRVAGIRLPGVGGIRESMPGQGEEFYNKFINTYKDIRAKNSGLSSAQAQQMTIAAMKSGLPSNSATAASDRNLGFGEIMAQVNPSEMITDMLTAVPRMGANLAKGALNLIPRAINAEAAVFGNKTRIPLIPDIPAVPDFTDFNTAPNVAERGDVARYLASRFVPAMKGFTGEAIPPADLGPITPEMRKRALAAKARRTAPDILRRLLPQYFDQPVMAGQ